MKPTDQLTHLNDSYLTKLKLDWFNNSHTSIDKDVYLPQSVEWFKSTAINDIQGWNAFPYQDVILGCTHFIESLLIRHGKNIQVLPGEYSYYRLMGINGTDPDDLLPNVPLIVSLPNWRYADLLPNWDYILKICEQRNIDIHIDMAWITVARDISIDLDHPCIKSFAMSLSKYSMEWNRVGIRWSRKRTVDSVTIFNHYQGQVNQNIISCGAYLVQNLPRDYGWDVYGLKYFEICAQHNLSATKVIHVAHDKSDNRPVGVVNLLIAD
jgi:hypothetical protein